MFRSTYEYLTALIFCSCLSVSAIAADDRFFVEIIGGGGRVDMERGPFGSFTEAQQWATDWQASRPEDYRLWRIKENPKPQEKKTPLDRFVAAGIQEIDEILKQSKDVSTGTGEAGPTSGEVLSEYKANVENAYQNAKALRDQMSQFANSAPAEILGKMDTLVEDITRQESERLVMVERSRILKSELDKQSSSAKDKQREMGEVIDKIGRTTGAEQMQLLNRLRLMQTSGSIREAVMAEAKSQDVGDELRSSQQIIAEIENAVVGNRERLEEISRSAEFQPVKSKDVSQDDHESLRLAFIGTWIGTRKQNYSTTTNLLKVTMTLNTDGTSTRVEQMSMKRRNGEPWIDTYNGQWKIQDGELTVTTGTGGAWGLKVGRGVILDQSHIWVKK